MKFKNILAPALLSAACETSAPEKSEQEIRVYEIIAEIPQETPLDQAIIMLAEKFRYACEDLQVYKQDITDNNNIPDSRIVAEDQLLLDIGAARDTLAPGVYDRDWVCVTVVNESAKTKQSSQARTDIKKSEALAMLNIGATVDDIKKAEDALTSLEDLKQDFADQCYSGYWTDLKQIVSERKVIYDSFQRADSNVWMCKRIGQNDFVTTVERK